MRIIWDISEEDVARVRSVVDEQKGRQFVVDRMTRNLATTKPPIREEHVWQELVGCLLSTQQRSGPKSPVARFMDVRPFPLSYAACCEKRDLRAFATSTLSQFGGIRRPPTLGEQIAENFKRLEGGIWQQVLGEMSRLNGNATRQVEVEVAEFIDKELAGFGPKQARNLLQGLGLTRYEIPIDSRISKWLKKFGFPAPISPAALSDSCYYRFVSTAVVELCERSGVFPCVLDAAVFSSFDEP